VVTPGPEAAAKDVSAVTRFWRALGARVVHMSPAEHDAAVAAISHVPHIAAAALSSMASDGQRAVVGTGWLDTTRIASGDTELWRQILEGNREQVCRALARFQRVVSQFQEALSQGNEKKLKQLLQTGKDHRDAVGG
jgi:prephenate dehydrogenase